MLVVDRGAVLVVHRGEAKKQHGLGSDQVLDILSIQAVTSRASYFATSLLPGTLRQ